jgi:DNA-binding NarL/FixJ family response regulator
MALIGREAQTRLLRGLIEGCDRRGATLLIRGDAGIGKSALVAEAAATAAASGFQVLTTEGTGTRARAPFAGRLVAPLAHRADRLPVHQRRALDSAVDGDGSTVPDAHLVALGVLDLVAEAAEDAPVLLVAEDVQWLDASTISVLAFLARRLESESVVFLATVRPGHYTRLDEARLPELTLPPLDPGASTALIETTASGLAPELRDQVLADAAGNPLALTELSRAALEQGRTGARPAAWPSITARLRDAFAARLDGLPEATRAAVSAAALNDGPSPAEALDAAALLTDSAATVLDLAPAVTARLVEIDDAGLRFRHPLIRSAIRESLTRAGQSAIHAALAAVLTEDEDRRTWHRAAGAAGPDEPIAARLESTAERAERRGAVGTAIAALEQAARLSSTESARADRLLRAAGYAVDLGRRDEVGRLVAAAERSASSPGQLAQLGWLRDSLDRELTDPASATLELAGLAASAALAGDRDLAVRILWSAAQNCYWSEPGPQARKRVAAVAEQIDPDGSDPWPLAIRAYAAPLDQGGTVIGRLHRPRAVTGDDPRADRLLGGAALLVGDLEAARRYSAAAVADLRAQGRLHLLARALGVQAWSSAQLGDLDTAAPAAAECARLARELDDPPLFALIRATQACIAAMHGDTEGALAIAAEAERAAEPTTARPVLARVQIARGLAALAAGEFEDAYRRLRRMHDPDEPCHQSALRWYAFGDLAEAAAGCGRSGELAAPAAELAELAGRTPSPALRAAFRYSRAVLSADSHGNASAAAFQEALDGTAAGLPLVRARTQLAYGRWLRARRRAVEARSALRAAQEAFDALGATAWSDRARLELRACGVSSAQPAAAAREQLTAQEVQIARMAAEGLTNREIGQRLHMSHRTISSHLYQIFPKLGISARAELAAIMADIR